jgi:predicted esterase
VTRWLAPLLLLAPPAIAQTAPVERIRAADADPAVKQFNDDNVILRPAGEKGLPPLVLFLHGTGGDFTTMPALLPVVAQQGYRVIGLAYNNNPAVQQVCPSRPDPNCAAKFREMRIWGTGGSTDIANPPAEAIVARLVALLRKLDALHPGEKWGSYLTADGKPIWSRIVVSGLSQGAGMAAYIAKREKVARVVCFSSPVDMLGGRTGTEVAPWLAMPSATPADRWYAERNSREPFNPGLIKAYPVLGIPADHVRVFSLDLPPGRSAAGNPMIYHTINTRDPRYADDWRFLYGKPEELRP